MYKIRKNKKGFTLIELIVTIALMMSILVLAVISFVGITNKNKENAKKLVKEQIETAAMEYFNSNEYLFSDLNEDSFGTISVGKLIEEDYLNVVTNPVTSKRIGNCTIVVVKRKNKNYTAKVDDDSFENATDTSTGTRLTNVCDSVIVSNEEEIDSKITYYDEDYNKITKPRAKDLYDNKKLWFNSKHLGKNRNLIACVNEGTELTVKKSTGESISVSEKAGYGYCVTIANGTNERITYSLKDGSWSAEVTERVDTTPPVVSNFKVESENGYIGGKYFSEIEEYKDKFYSFKLNPLADVKISSTYNDRLADIRRAKVSCYKSGNRRCYENQHDAEDIIVDGKLMMLKNTESDKTKSDKNDDFSPRKIDELVADLKDNGGIYLLSEIDESNFPADISDYYNYYNYSSSNIYYDLNHKNNYRDLHGYRLYNHGTNIANEHIVNGETRKVYNKNYIYYTNQNIICRIYIDENGRYSSSKKNVCAKIIEAYPNSLNVNTYGIFRTFDRSIPHKSSDRKKIKTYVRTYIEYDREINGQLTKVTFDYDDDTSKVYSYGLNKKYEKEEKNTIDDNLINTYLNDVLKSFKNLTDIEYDRELYNYTYSIDKKTVLKDNGLNEEYNKNVLKTVEVSDLVKSEKEYVKNKINKESDNNVSIEHIYADGELDGSIDKYSLTITDNAGNVATSEADYEKYKICTYAKWTEFFDGTEEYCEDVCNSYGTLVRRTGKIAYLLDEITGDFCPYDKWPPEERNAGVTEERSENDGYCPWTDCSVNTTTTKKTTTGNNKTETYTRKAYKFSEMTKFCDNTSSINFHGCGISIDGASCNLSPSGPYKRYKFKELECTCTNNNGTITATSKDVTSQTHPDGYSYIFYTSKDNCNKSASDGKNNVKQVCTRKIDSSMNFHGVHWNQGSNNYWSGEGWYNNKYTKKEKVDAFTSEKAACKWACEQ